jgi:hypothetical protein
MKLIDSVKYSHQQVDHFILAVPKQGHDVYYGKYCLIGDAVYTFNSINPMYVILRTAQILDIRSNQIELPDENLFVDVVKFLLEAVIFVTLDILVIDFFKTESGIFDFRSNLFRNETRFEGLNMFIEELMGGQRYRITESEYFRFHIQEYIRSIIDGIFSTEKILAKNKISYPPYGSRLPKMTLKRVKSYSCTQRGQLVLSKGLLLTPVFNYMMKTLTLSSIVTSCGNR